MSWLTGVVTVVCMLCIAMYCSAWPEQGCAQAQHRLRAGDGGLGGALWLLAPHPRGLHRVRGVQGHAASGVGRGTGDHRAEGARGEQFKDTVPARVGLKEREVRRSPHSPENTEFIVASCCLQKRDKRVIDNWTRLTKGLLIRKRLQEKYDLTVSA